MTEQSPYPVPPHGADDDALTASRTNLDDSSSGTPILFGAVLVACWVLRLLGVW